MSKPFNHEGKSIDEAIGLDMRFVLRTGKKVIQIFDKTNKASQFIQAMEEFIGGDEDTLRAVLAYLGSLMDEKSRERKIKKAALEAISEILSEKSCDECGMCSDNPQDECKSEEKVN